MNQVRRAFGTAVTLLLIAACGQAPGKPTSAIVSPVTTPSANATATVSASPTAAPSASSVASATPTAKPAPAATPKVSPTLLFVVLEAKGTANPWTYNTVAIAGLDGYARAKTTFTPMPVPVVGCMGAILPHSAQVAAGKVYFADGYGVVRSLGTDNKVTTVATFPMTSTQQMLSFAVSPDGTQIVGTIFTTPKTGACGPNSGTLTFDAYRVTSPTTNDLVYHQGSIAFGSVMALTGWDALGPFGTYPTIWASQGGGPGSDLGVYVRIDATTLKPGAPFSDPYKCRVWDSTASGAFVCMNDPLLSVRMPNGTEAWKLAISGTASPHLNPNMLQVATCCTDDSLEWVLGRDGSRIKAGAGFFATGWLDSTTLVGEYRATALSQDPLPVAYVAVNSPSVVVSMGFTGRFVGTVRA